MTLGQQITALRKKKGFSQAELGKRVETVYVGHNGPVKSVQNE